MTSDIAEADEVVSSLANLLVKAQLAQSTLHQSLFGSSVELVTIKEFCKRTGYTESAVNGKINDGKWIEGEVLVKTPDNNRLIDLREFSKWSRGAYS